MRLVLIASAAALMLAGPVSAQQTAPVEATSIGAQTTTSTTSTKATKPRTAISVSCSSQADTKGLHGKDRKKFRRTCMKAVPTT